MHPTRRRPTTALLALLAALAVVLAACGGEDTAGDAAGDADAGEETAAPETGGEATQDPNEGTAADADASPPSTVGQTEGDDTAAFLEDPSYYLTEQPTLTGTVQEVVGTSGFTLGGEDWQDVTVFVAATEEQLSEIATGDQVTVSGELLEIQEEEINVIAAQAQDQLGVSVDERYLQSLTGQYALIPDSFVQGAGGATEAMTETP